jgi:hypothetical protein
MVSSRPAPQINLMACVKLFTGRDKSGTLNSAGVTNRAGNDGMWLPFLLLGFLGVRLTQRPTRQRHRKILPKMDTGGAEILIESIRKPLVVLI